MAKTKELKIRIAELLIDYPILRESKSHLQSVIWYEESIEMGITSVLDFLEAFSEGKLSNAESIRRGACKLQEDYPELAASKKTQEKNIKLAEIIRKNKGEL